MSEIQGASALDDEAGAGAFIGRVLASLAVLIVLAVMAAVLVGLAYVSKHSRSAPTPPPAGQSAAASLSHPASGSP